MGTGDDSTPHSRPGRIFLCFPVTELWGPAETLVERNRSNDENRREFRILWPQLVDQTCHNRLIFNRVFGDTAELQL